MNMIDATRVRDREPCLLPAEALASPLFEYKGALYPDYIRCGNACRFIQRAALAFCRGHGVDVGAGDWPLPGAIPVDLKSGGEAMALPAGRFDYVFSSHCLEHLADPVGALLHWKSRLRPGGCLFLYLPHPDMVYWRPQHNRKHLHSWRPKQLRRLLADLGFVDVIGSGRDLAWSFATVGFNPGG